MRLEPTPEQADRFSRDADGRRFGRNWAVTAPVRAVRGQFVIEVRLLCAALLQLGQIPPAVGG